jgi:methionyl-tRNA synthetase
MLSFEEFKKVELRVATVRAASRVEGSEKLLALSLDDGSPDGRTVVAGIGTRYEPETLVGRQVAIVANLAPRKLMGLESNGMLLAAHGEGGEPVVLGPDGPVPSGSLIS